MSRDLPKNMRDGERPPVSSDNEIHILHDMELSSLKVNAVLSLVF